MDKRIIFVIAGFLSIVTGFVIYNLFFSKKQTIRIDYVINNIKDDKAYKDSTIEFIDRTIDAKEWKWNFGDGQYGFGKNQKHVYNSIGTYNIILTVTTLNGTSIDSQKKITVFEAPPIVKIDTVAVKPTVSEPVAVTNPTPTKVENVVKPMQKKMPPKVAPKKVHKQRSSGATYNATDDEIHEMKEQTFDK